MGATTAVPTTRLHCRLSLLIRWPAVDCRGHSYHSPIGSLSVLSLSHPTSGSQHNHSCGSIEHCSHCHPSQLSHSYPCARSGRCGSTSDSHLPATHRTPASSCHLDRHAWSSRSPDLKRRAEQSCSSDRSKQPGSSGWTVGHQGGTVPATTPRSLSSHRRMSPKEDRRPAKSSLWLISGQEAVRSLAKSLSILSSHMDSLSSQDRNVVTEGETGIWSTSPGASSVSSSVHIHVKD